MKHLTKYFAILLLILALSNCQSDEKKSPSGKLKIVCTTGMLGDAVQNLVGEQAEVITLMGSGVDPHLYKATQGDLKNLSAADVIIYNGLHLEGKMGEIFKKLENRKHIIVASDALAKHELINNTEFQGAHDPHIWFDVNLWSKVATYLGNELIMLDSSLQEVVLANSSKYSSSLSLLDKQVLTSINQIDSSKRVLITAHDAFGYFGKAYQIEVKGLQGISTASEYGLKDVSDLVNFITNREIGAVFVESSVSDRSLKAVVEGCKARGHEIKIGGTLYSDAMGKKGSKEGTYIGMVEHNVKLITEGLR